MNDSDIRLRDELIRKSIHAASLWIPLGYRFFPKRCILIPLAVLLGIALLVEVLRSVWTPFEARFERFLGSLLRPRERTNLTGATTLLISAFLCIVFFEKWIALLAILLMLVSDALGAVVGRFWGRRYYKKGRSIEGSMAFLVSGLALIPVVPEVNLPIAVVGVLAALFFEVALTKLDDNFGVPIGSGLVMEILALFFGA